mmetsp:Transcript_65527/g.156614  ORF Transcript_65527/g.156614 Transcript_65527/m.156614 type:complete len:422 (-) Transcript_65527:70-1335(-)
MSIYLHALHGSGGPWCCSGFESVISEFLSYREALECRLRVTMLCGQPDLPAHRINAVAREDAPLKMDKGQLTGNAACIPLLMSDVLHVPDAEYARRTGSFLLAIAPRHSAETGNLVKQVWFVRFAGAFEEFEVFLSKLSVAGVLRWDTESLGNWEKSQPVCWSRMKQELTFRFPACITAKRVSSSAAKIEREVKILTKCHGHPNIHSFVGVFCVDSKRTKKGKARSTWALAMEYHCGGDLWQQIQWRGSMDEPSVIKAMIGVTSALTFLHGLRIVHRDVRAPLVLLSYDGTGVLSDFSLAVDLNAPGKPVPHESPYAAPELTRPDFDERVDVFSIGVLMFLALTGIYPYCGNPSAVRAVNFNLPSLDGVCGSLRLLLRTALAREAKHRPSARNLFATLWNTATNEVKALTNQSALSLGAAD